jgi:hypothetical protein
VTDRGGVDGGCAYCSMSEAAISNASSASVYWAGLGVPDRCGGFRFNRGPCRGLSSRCPRSATTGRTLRGGDRCSRTSPAVRPGRKGRVHEHVPFGFADSGARRSAHMSLLVRSGSPAPPPCATGTGLVRLVRYRPARRTLTTTGWRGNATGSCGWGVDSARTERQRTLSDVRTEGLLRVNTTCLSSTC